MPKKKLFRHLIALNVFLVHLDIFYLIAYLEEHFDVFYCTASFYLHND